MAWTAWVPFGLALPQASPNDSHLKLAHRNPGSHVAAQRSRNEVMRAASGALLAHLWSTERRPEPPSSGTFKDFIQKRADDLLETLRLVHVGQVGRVSEAHSPGGGNTFQHVIGGRVHVG